MSTSQQNKEFKFYIAKGSDWAIFKDIANPEDDEQDQVWVENEDIEGLRSVGGIFINDAFLPLWDCNQKLMFLAGGYGSSKTTFVITRLLTKCLTYKSFKCFYGRQKKTEAVQLHSNIITEIKRNHWEKYFTYSEAPTGSKEISCNLNGNKFVLFGCDDVASLKGWDNPTHIFVDEINQIEFSAFGMLFSRLRKPGCELQLIGNFNNCDVFPDHWLVKYIYTEETKVLGGESSKEKTIIKTLSNIKVVKHHSTYLDNYFVNPKAYLLTLELQAGGDESKIKAYAEGQWGVKLESHPFYKKFNREKHVGDCIIDGSPEYNPLVPLWISWDENSNPYLPLLILQRSGNDVFVIDEITGRNPNNTLIWVCEEVIRRYGSVHRSKMYICGDATSEKDDVKLEKGKNLFTLAAEYLSQFYPEIRKEDANPNVALRGNFINAIFSMGYEKITVTISPKCVNFIQDLTHCQESPDGKGKDKTKTMVDGVRGVQRWGHLSDCFDYFMCESFRYEYTLFQTQGRTYRIQSGKRQVLNSSDYEAKTISIPIEGLEKNDKEKTKVLVKVGRYFIPQEIWETDDDEEESGRYRRRSSNGY